MSHLGSYGGALQASFQSPRFGTIYKVHNRQQPDQPQVFRQNSIYDLMRQDTTFYSQLSQAAIAADQAQGRNPNQDRWHAYSTPKLFLYQGHVYVTTGDDAALVQDFIEGGNNARAKTWDFPGYGQTRQEQFHRQHEARYPDYLNLDQKAANNEIQPLPFRPIREPEPVEASPLMAWFRPRPKASPHSPNPIEMETFSRQSDTASL